MGRGRSAPVAADRFTVVVGMTRGVSVPDEQSRQAPDRQMLAELGALLEANSALLTNVNRAYEQTLGTMADTEFESVRQCEYAELRAAATKQRRRIEVLRDEDERLAARADVVRARIADER